MSNWIIRSFKTACFLRYYLLLVGQLSMLTGFLSAQDPRDVKEPQFPHTCAVYSAPLATTANGPGVGASIREQDAESRKETREIKRLISICPKGQAVELATGAHNSLSAFLIDPIRLPEGVSLIIDGGVTVFGSRNPAVYQDKSGWTCGLLGDHGVNFGCKPLITLRSNTGIYGSGVIDAQGDKIMLGNANKATWWDQTIYKKGSLQPNNMCTQPNPAHPSAPGNMGDCEQSSPLVLSTDSESGKTIKNIVLYKITVRNPPYHTNKLVGEDFTIWGVKVQAPWNLPNTDGFDIRAKNATFFDDTVANGDQEITIVSSGGSAKKMTIENFHGYGKGGITILGNGDSTSQILVNNAQITGDLPSVINNTVDGKSDITVNGFSYSEMKRQYKLKSWGQALPNSTDDMKALQISNASSNSEAGSDISGIIFNSVCVSDIGNPIAISIGNSSSPGFVHDVVFRDVHVLKPTSQFPLMKKGIVAEPVAPGTKPKLGRYTLYFDAPLDQHHNPASTNEITLDNVVFDPLSEKESSIGFISAVGNQFTADTNAYPSVFYDLAKNISEKDGVKLTLQSNSYVGNTGVSEPYLANACHRMPFLTGDLMLATHERNVRRHVGESVTLEAVVQPVMSQTTLFFPNSYGAQPGLLSIGSPALTKRIKFYDDWTPIGSAALSANGTLASFTVQHLKAGVHVFRAEYPADRYYTSLPFGAVTVSVQN